MTEIDDDLFGDLMDDAPVEDPEVVLPRRGRKPYQVATERPATALQASAGGESLFDIMGTKPDLNEIYPMQRRILELSGSNGLKVVSTFTGCGGSATGFAWAGWKELLANEFVAAARETLAANYPSHIITPKDVLEVARPIAEKLGVPLTVEKGKRVKGIRLDASVNWELTIHDHVTVPDGLEDQIPHRREEIERLRYEVCSAALESVPKNVMAIWGDDIRALDGYAVMEHLGLKPGELDCFEGSPPCKSFSTSGLREQGWGERLHYSDERDQRTDDLFYEYLRLLKAFRPRSFIAENVAGLTMGSAEMNVMRPLLREFRELGYRVEAKLVNSANYAVPQSRPRVLFMGIREDQHLVSSGRPTMPSWPDEQAWTYTVQEALDAAAPDNTPEQLEYVKLDNRGNGKPDYETAKIWHTLGHGAAPQNKAWQLIRCHPDLPAPTITATSAGNQPAAGPCHPHECRKFTIPEYRRLFGFPRDFQFTGNIDQQGERMGRSVPPFLMMQVADTLASLLNNSRSVADIEG